MLKYDNTVSSTIDGKPIYGAQVNVYDESGAVASLFSDEAGTTHLSQPILTDQLGYFSFYIADGKYDIRVMTGAVEISRTNITMVDTLTLKERALLVPVNEDAGTLPAAEQRLGMVLGFDQTTGAPTALLPNKFEGPAGPANSTYKSLVALKAAPSTNTSYTLADGVNPPVQYAFVAGDFTGKADDSRIVALNDTPILQGALIRQDAGGITYAFSGVNAKPRKLTLEIDDLTATPKRFGAVGSGNSAAADQSGFSAAINYAMTTGRYVAGIGQSSWAHPQDGLFLPPGVYDASQLTLTGNTSPSPQLSLWAIPGSVIVRIPDGAYLFEAPDRVNGFYCYGINFVGGKGVFHQTWTADNVRGFISFERCYFDNYTECAIGNNSVDAPYLRVIDCIFMAAYKSSAIGVAWGGYADDCVLERNSFLRNKYHIKLGPYLSGSAHAVRNDFINWDTYDPVNHPEIPLSDATPHVADIWVVPATGASGSNSGNGIIFSANKFGGENVYPGQVRVLVANEGPGADRQTRHHSTTFDSGAAFLSGVTIKDSRASGNAQTDGPFIRSYIAELRTLSWMNNRHDGGVYTYLCEFMGARKCDYTNMNWNVSLDASSALTGASPFVKGISNSLVGFIHDATGFLASDDAAMLYPAGGDDTGFVLVGSADVYNNFLMAEGATGVPISSSFGEPTVQAVEVTVPAANSSATYLSMSNVQGDRLAWVCLDLMQGSSTSVKSVVVRMRNFTTGVDAIKTTIALPSTWRRFRIPVQIPADSAPASWQLKIQAADYSASANKFRVGRAYIYHGREAQRDGHIRTMGDGSWAGPHLIMGAWHLWIDGAGSLRIKSGAPTSATDGTVVGAQS